VVNEGSREPSGSSTNTRSIRWHGRLEARVAVGVSAIVGVALVAMLFATGRIVQANALARATDDLEAARVAFYHLVDSRAQSAAAQLRLIAELPVFRAHLTDVRIARDEATVYQMADDYRRSLGAHFSIVTDPAGTWIASPGWPASIEIPKELARAIAAAGAGQSHRAIVAVDGRLSLVVTEPARFASEVLATLTAGYQLDDAVADELAVTTRCDVNLIANQRLSASSLPLKQRENLVDLLAGHPDALGRLRQDANLREIGTAHYVSGVYPLHPDAGAASAGTLVLLQDWEPTRQFVEEIRARVLWLGSVTFALALGGGLLVSRRITRSLREIAAMAGEVAAGRWDRPVPVHGNGETAAMAIAFNNMTASLSHSYEMLLQREMELRQAQKMEAVGRLAGGVAHDFNNLLTAIYGYSELLFVEVKDDQHRADIMQIMKAAESATSLTRQLLAFSRKQILAPKIVSLDEIVRGIEKMLRRLIGEHIELRVRSAPKLWPVKADPGQIEQVVMNLALNARDAMPDGGRLSIELDNVAVDDDSGSPAQCVRLTVSDDGCGMDAETLSHIFEPFFTTKAEGRGTGLGLAMVHGIVEQSGGSIAVQSEPGRGTSFIVTLPRAHEDAVPTGSADLDRKATDGSETVLLVEDEPGVRELAAMVLRKHGYEVLEAGRGEEALAIAARHPRAIHLLLSDVVMPGMSGRDLWERLSAARRETKVLFMSGYTDDAVVRHRIGEASLPYLQKPFTRDTLADAVRRALDSQPAVTKR
jgi:signal transduction histidine kinase/ActR/RegA family two-component response regulator